MRQEQLSKKEQETNKLANQRQKAKEAAALVVEKISDETNAYQLSNIQSDVKKLDLSITLPTKSKITVTKDGETINDDTKVYTGTFTQSLELSENCTFEISIETYSDNSITIDGKEISFDKTDWQEGQPAVITYRLEKEIKKRLKNIHNMMIVSMIMVTQMNIMDKRGIIHMTKMNIPNRLTIIRILLVPVVVAVYLCMDPTLCVIDETSGLAFEM